MGDRGEGVLFLCHILTKFINDRESGVNKDTMIKLYPAAGCKESSYEFKPTLTNTRRYSNNNMNLQRYYKRFGFVMESNTDACSLMQVNIEEILRRCSIRGGSTRTKTRKSRRSRRSKSRMNKKSRRNI
jgi:hypothetical protein